MGDITQERQTALPYISQEYQQDLLRIKASAQIQPEGHLVLDEAREVNYYIATMTEKDGQGKTSMRGTVYSLDMLLLRRLNI